MQTIWYFDFVSPFAYFQRIYLQQQAADLAVQCCPVLFAGMLKHWQHKGPAEIPSKRSMTYQHCHWLAQQHGIAYKTPPSHPFNPLKALRLAIACDNQPQVLDALFAAIWRDGLDVNQAATWSKVAEQIGLTPSELDARVGQPEVKQQLHTNTAQAVAAGVFGVPTLSLDGRLFWGFDMTDMALAYWRQPQLFDAAEYQRLAELPGAG